MIDRFSTSLAYKLDGKEGMPQFDVIRYAIKVSLTNGIPIVLMFVMGLVLQNLSYIVLSASSFALLRKLTGGYHIKSAEICVICSTALILTLAVVAPVLAHFNMCMSIASIVLVLIFGAKDIGARTIVKQENLYIFKIAAILLVLLSIALDNAYISFAFFIQSLLLIKINIKNVKGGE